MCGHFLLINTRMDGWMDKFRDRLNFSVQWRIYDDELLQLVTLSLAMKQTRLWKLTSPDERPVRQRVQILAAFLISWRLFLVGKRVWTTCPMSLRCNVSGRGSNPRWVRRDTTRRLYLLAVLLADRFQRRRTLRIESIPDFRRCWRHCQLLAT